MICPDSSQIGYVVSLEGTKIKLNLLDEHKGQLASHRSGINSVSQPGDLIGIEAARYLIIAKVAEMAFVEPDKAHSSHNGILNISSIPLRQLVCYAIGYIKSQNEHDLEFISENWMLPPLGSKAVPLGKNFLDVIYGLSTSDKTHSIKLGVDARTGSVPIYANINSLLSRHLAVLGSTGYGKSNLNTIITRYIAEKYSNSRIVIFDVNGEYAQAFEGLPKIKQTIIGNGIDTQPTSKQFKKEDVSYRKIPYQAFGWSGLIKLLRPSDKTQLPALRNALRSLPFVKENPADLTSMVVEQVPPKFPNGAQFLLYDDCRQDHQEHLGAWLKSLLSMNVSRQESWPPFKAIANLVAEFGCVTASRNQNTTERNAFNYGNVLPLIKVIHQLCEDSRFNFVINTDGGQHIDHTQVWDKPLHDEVDYIFGKKSGDDNDWNVHIINLKNLADDLSPIILGALLEMYSEVLFKRGQGNSHPTLLVLEEAHQYIRDPYNEDSNQVKAYERIAKEGRKFGCSLLVSTQRPSELSSTVLAMCSNWISLRLTNERDLTTLRYAVEHGNEQLINEISGLPRGDAIAFGSAFNLPIRFSIDKAVPGPLSNDADFANIWNSK
ncbi:ATP-binding protein [Aeromonas allosaccharophila]|uniref:ATP-binding protein n=1 Tax=Aeromonas allosaccharophila TaxID=656 RepID=UPI003D198E93